ncbi:hypothetical protein PSCICO_11600 [Pseudomonas cichorii]|nr:hypothetical protein PSCICO_11600 [Pseudomonas cichorii]
MWRAMAIYANDVDTGFGQLIKGCRAHGSQAENSHFTTLFHLQAVPKKRLFQRTGAGEATVKKA